MRDSGKQYTIFDAATVPTTSKAIYVGDYRTAVVTIETASSADMIIKFLGAATVATAIGGNTAPNFSSAQAVGNFWDYVEVIDLEDGAAIDGDTGISLTGTDDFRQVEINTNGLQYLAVAFNERSASGGVAGSLTVKVRLYDNL